MKEMTIYCSARDQDVHVVLTDDPTHDAQAACFDAELVCLEIGDRCTGGMCPLCAQPSEVMDARLVKSGLAGGSHCHVSAKCDDCGRETDHVLSLGGYVTCAECRGTRKLVAVH